MAADMLASAGVSVTLCDAKPSVGRKFLMAGKSGLNLTKDQATEPLIQVYAEAAPHLRPMIEAFDADAIQNWARGLGQEVFTGSTGRVFPRAMKSSPLLRAWLARLDELGVQRLTLWRWTGWADGGLAFDTPDGPKVLQADATILALGGASWARLGSDGAWAGILSDQGVTLSPFGPANVGLRVDWSDHMRPVLGQPIKGVTFIAGGTRSRGEAVISKSGLEGGGLYALSRPLREGAALTIDLMPDLTLDAVTARLSRPQGKLSLSNHLRKTLRLGPVRTALLQELGRPLPTEPAKLAQRIKSLPVPYVGMQPIDQAISTSGGVSFDALDEGLMLRQMPGVFCAGEMLDWEAPTGGYLLTACFASGRWAGQAAARYLKAD
jgi:uncharacterized flavoprotein (TIGR03862 family)